MVASNTIEAHEGKRAGKGNRMLEKEFDQAWQENAGTLLSFAARFAGHNEDAEDLVSEAYLKGRKACAAFRGEAAFTSWAFRVMRNAYLDGRKRVMRRPEISLEALLADGGDSGEGDWDVPSGEATPEELVVQGELRQAVRAAVAELPEGQREAVRLVDLADVGWEDAAALMGIPTGTLKSRVNRARQALKKRLAPVLA
jgi:RNA polymerase sigma-70 factor (ECF subfamily)